VLVHLAAGHLRREYDAARARPLPGSTAIRYGWDDIDRDPELSGMFQLHLARLETSFAAALARARADGELRPGAGPESASMLLAVVQGMNVMAKGKPGRRTLQGAVEAALAGLAASPPSA
jgi:hypothetical protein